MRKVRLAIIGCRKMGGKHLNLLCENFSKEVDIVGILNSTPESTQKCAQELKVPAFSNLDEITQDRVDAVIISTPASSHCNIGCQILRRSIPCLIEKPLGVNVVECENLISAAREGNTFILAGHTENYNPAVLKLKEILDSPIVSLEAVRVSQTGSPQDVSVIKELMIHDLAIVNSLIRSPLSKANVTKKSEYTWCENALAVMDFADGSHAKVEGIIHVNDPMQRYMKIIDAKGNKFEILFKERQLFRNGELICTEGDSLVNELGNFVGSLLRTQTPLVGPEEALQNVKLCNELEKCIKN